MSFLLPQQAFDLAHAHLRAGRWQEAQTLLARLAEIYPDEPEFLHLQGLALYHGGALPAALDLFQRAIAAQPHAAHYYNNLGTLLNDLHRPQEAAVACENALRLDARCVEAHYNLGNARLQQRQWAAAISAFRTTLQLQPGHPKAILNLGLALSANDEVEAAIAHYRAALSLQPGNIAWLSNLGSFLLNQARLDEAAEIFQTILSLDPGNIVAWNNLGNILKDQGRSGDALAAYRRALTLNPQSAEIHSNILLSLYLHPASTAETIAQEQRLWQQQHGEPLRRHFRPHLNDRSPERRLRVGYVSPDFRSHPVGHTLLPIFAAHDRAHFAWFCYSTAPPDAVTERFRAQATHWRDVEEMTEETLAARIREDGIDILVDLALHTSHHRLLAFARKPAPVQVSWLGYPGTTGLEAIDYRLTDRFLDPPDSQGELSYEKPILLPDCWCAFQAPAHSPEVGELPAARTGHITFGSFNNFSKINDRVLDLWARLLVAVPDSRLLLLAKVGSHQQRTRSFLQERGIAAHRLEFLGYRPTSKESRQADFLRRYHQIDIALDPFPYNGMTTTCEALWMGVPVITLVGATSMARASFSLLSNAGLSEFATDSEENYLRIAIELAHDQSRLAEWRKTLRSRMLSSPLTDVPRFARNIENAYREMWHHWCARSAG
jgi:predicted O-linked N-acetylglucosamine transferase (SPINDLY family)